MSVRDVDELVAALNRVEHLFASTELSSDEVQGFDSLRSDELELEDTSLVCTCPPLVLSICSLQSETATLINQDICTRTAVESHHVGKGGRGMLRREAWPNPPQTTVVKRGSPALLIVLTNGSNTTFARTVFVEELLGIQNSFSSGVGPEQQRDVANVSAAVNRCQTRFPVCSPAMKPNGAEWLQFFRTLFSTVRCASGVPVGISATIADGDLRDGGVGGGGGGGGGAFYGETYEPQSQVATTDRSGPCHPPLLCPLHDSRGGGDNRLSGSIAMMRFAAVTWEVPLFFYPDHAMAALWLSRMSRVAGVEVCTQLQAMESQTAQMRIEMDRLKAGIQGGASDGAPTSLSASGNAQGGNSSTTVLDSDRKPANLLNPQQRGATKRPRGMKIH